MKVCRFELTVTVTQPGIPDFVDGVYQEKFGPYLADVALSLLPASIERAVKSVEVTGAHDVVVRFHPLPDNRYDESGFDER